MFPCVWEEDVIALLRRDCTRQQPQTRRKLNPPSLSFALPAVNLLPGSRAPAQVLSFINELWKPSGSICLKSWQTAGRFGSWQILWALGAGPLPPSQWGCFPPTAPLSFSTVISLCLMLGKLLRCHQFSTMVSLQEKNALVCDFGSHDKVLGLTISSKYLKIHSLEKDSAEKICWPCWNLLKFSSENWAQYTILIKLFRGWN